MKKQTNKKTIIFTALTINLILLFTVFTCLANNNIAKAANASTQEQIFSRIGKMLKNDTDLADQLKASNKNNLIDEIMPVNINSDNVVATVNGWPITKGEIEYRMGMRQAVGQIADANYIFNSLVEEKVKISEAQAYGVLPTMEEVNKNINNRKQMINEDSESKEAINSFIKQLQFSNDDYWNVYEVYNQFRVMAFTNLWQAMLQEGRNNGLIAPENAIQDEIAKYEYTNTNDYYFDKLIEFKKNATISIIDNNDTLYTPVLDKVFMFHGAPEEGMSKKDLDNDTASQTTPTTVSVRRVSANISKTVSDTSLQAVIDHGWLYFPYKISFYGYQYDEDGQQVISPMDIIIYRTTQYDPSIESLVSGCITACKVLNSGGSVVHNFTGSFDNSLNWSYITNYGLVYGRGSSGGTVGASGSYKVKVTGCLFIDDATPGADSTTMTTTTF